MQSSAKSQIIVFLSSFFPGPYASAYRSSPGCELPSSWDGRWFEYGERDAVRVASANASVSHKGECIYKKGDKYIFKDK